MENLFKDDRRDQVSRPSLCQRRHQDSISEDPHERDKQAKRSEFQVDTDIPRCGMRSFVLSATGRFWNSDCFLSAPGPFRSCTPSFGDWPKRTGKKDIWLWDKVADGVITKVLGPWSLHAKAIVFFEVNKDKPGLSALTGPAIRPVKTTTQTVRPLGWTKMMQMILVQ